MNILQRAQIEGIAAQGEAHIRLINSTRIDKAKKAIAIAETVINTQLAIIKLLNGVSDD